MRSSDWSSDVCSADLVALLGQQGAQLVHKGVSIAIFRVMAGLPVTIRLLDPPLHEFLPTREEDFAEVAAAAGVGIDTLKARASEQIGRASCRDRACQYM